MRGPARPGGVPELRAPAIERRNALADPPPDAVLAAFEVDPRCLRPLPGGQRTAWSAGSLVLKPLDKSIQQLAWEEQVLEAIPQRGFRLAPPVRTREGQLVVASWTACKRLDGEHRPGRWAEICAIGERFHQATADIAAPGWHRQRSDVFAQADRIAWDEAKLAEFQSVAPVDQLAALLRPVHGHDQLIHGDLSGNVLFHPTLAAGIIDLAPYRRPRYSLPLSSSSMRCSGKALTAQSSNSSVTTPTPLSTCCAPPSSASSWTSCAAPGAARVLGGGLERSG